MTAQEMKESICKNGRILQLLTQFPVNDHFQIGVYQGTLSEFDMIIRYKQRIGNTWTRSRTPKHIHWAVDILIKQHENPNATNEFLDFLLNYWNNIPSLGPNEHRSAVLNTDTLMREVNDEASRYQDLATNGEYSVKFLILLAKLLMRQEKINNPQAYMFKRLLEQLKEHSDIFRIVSTATL